MTLISLVAGCALFTPQPKGQIVVQVVSWPLVKKWAERLTQVYPDTK
jgi:hypothetical protein